jgi:hypothetical protein
MALLDNDEEGKRARDTLCDRFMLQNKKEVTNYGELFGGEANIEAEDLWPSALYESFVKSQGEDEVLAGKWKRKDGGWHYDVPFAAKPELARFLKEKVRASDAAKWVELLTLLRHRLGMSTLVESA